MSINKNKNYRRLDSVIGRDISIYSGVFRILFFWGCGEEYIIENNDFASLKTYLFIQIMK